MRVSLSRRSQRAMGIATKGNNRLHIYRQQLSRQNDRIAFFSRRTGSGQPYFAEVGFKSLLPEPLVDWCPLLRTSVPSHLWCNSRSLIIHPTMKPCCTWHADPIGKASFIFYIMATDAHHAKVHLQNNMLIYCAFRSKRNMIEVGSQICLTNWQMIKMIQVTNFSRLGMVRFPFQLDTLLAIVYTTHWSTGHRSNLGHQLAQIRVLENRHKFTIHIFPFNKYIKNAMQIGVDNYDQLYD